MTHNTGVEFRTYIGPFFLNIKLVGFGMLTASKETDFLNC